MTIRFQSLAGSERDDGNFISEMVFCLRRLGEATEVAPARPVLLARRDCVTAPGRSPPPEDGLRRWPVVALLCNGRMDDVRDGVIALRRKYKGVMKLANKLCVHGI